MGSTVGDVNNDGNLDLLLTAISCPHCGQGGSGVSQGMLFYSRHMSGNRLYLGGDLTAEGSYENLFDDKRTVEYGVHDGGWGWG